ncbi:uncharacterized protein H6S33_011578 [Morchella sextelata]|uniref:uncharacterized protein n=1 Tax=Morchella sextelata TaxID=1174677 RepID=UPI001D056A56|nr:uncharacterized protein H6S33_011578 [Morchella sextelata]KAH0611151.1 hypothetical protein H6S33_011578 [Morchella sextelata]
MIGSRRMRQEILPNLLRAESHEENPRRRSKRLRGKGGVLGRELSSIQKGRRGLFLNRLFGESGEETTGSEDTLRTGSCKMHEWRGGTKTMIANCCSATSALLNKGRNTQFIDYMWTRLVP